MGELVSLTEVKEFMQVTTTTSDALIESYISMIEGEVSAYVDRNLARGTYTESLSYLQSTFDHTGYTNLDAQSPAPSLFLKNVPVISLSISSNNNAYPTQSYSYNPENGVITADAQLSEPTATYVAGYTTVTAPQSLKGVIKLGVTSLFNNNGIAKAGSGNVNSKKIKDFSVTYDNGQTGYVTSQDGKLTKNYLASNHAVLERFMKVNI